MASLEPDGYLLISDALSTDTVDALISAMERLPPDPAVLRRRGSAYAARNLLELAPEVGTVLGSIGVRALVEAVLGPEAFAVRALLLDKTPDANWRVGWHQDLIVPVRRRVEATGYTGWSVKAGVPHVRPPAEVLQRMVTIRLHLDDCGAENGPLRVLPRSHQEGFLRPEQIRAWQERATAVSCPVPRGGALLMRPLLLHASSASAAPTHRRVLHIEWAADPLPGGLEWPLPGRKQLRHWG